MEPGNLPGYQCFIGEEIFFILCRRSCVCIELIKEWYELREM